MRGGPSLSSSLLFFSSFSSWESMGRKGKEKRVVGISGTMYTVGVGGVNTGGAGATPAPALAPPAMGAGAVVRVKAEGASPEGGVEGYTIGPLTTSG